MTQNKISNWFSGLIISLLSAAIIGGFLFYTSTQVFQASQNKVNESLKKEMDGLKKSTNNLSRKIETSMNINNIQHSILNSSMDTLKYELYKTNWRLKEYARNAGISITDNSNNDNNLIGYK